MNVASESALVSLIEQRRNILSNSGAGGNEQVIFLDNRLTPTPECILRDPALNPYDKILWQGILSIAETENPPGAVGAGTVMPTYDQLSQLVNVSRMSIASSLAALRATRWLIVNQIRDTGGAMRGQLYVIAYQPWDLSYALEIDERYIDWLESQTEDHHNRRIQRIAQAVWDTITEDRRHGVDIMAPIDPILKTLEASKALQNQSGRFYSIGANALKTLTRRQSMSDSNVVLIEPPHGGNATRNRRVRNAYSVHPLTSNEPGGDRGRANSDRIPTSRSSSNLYKNTTTTNTEIPFELRGLVFPPRLRPIDQQRIGKVLLGLLPNQPQAQQMLLDELGGRMKWGQGFKGGPAAWFKGTVQAFLRMQDVFMPNYADKYARLREREAAEQQKRRERDRPRTEEQGRRAEEALDRIRQQLSTKQSNRRTRT